MRFQASGYHLPAHDVVHCRPVSAALAQRGAFGCARGATRSLGVRRALPALTAGRAAPTGGLRTAGQGQNARPRERPPNRRSRFMFHRGRLKLVAAWAAMLGISMSSIGCQLPDMGSAPSNTSAVPFPTSASAAGAGNGAPAIGRVARITRRSNDPEGRLSGRRRQRPADLRGSWRTWAAWGHAGYARADDGRRRAWPDPTRNLHGVAAALHGGAAGCLVHRRGPARAQAALSRRALEVLIVQVTDTLPASRSTVRSWFRRKGPSTSASATAPCVCRG